MKYLLDTNICVYVVKNRIPSLTNRIFFMDPFEIAISSITVFELEYGASKSSFSEQTRRQTARFLEPFVILPFDKTDAAMAGEIHAFLTSSGNRIGPYDTLIAAQGVARKLTVVTHNTGEFSRVPGIMLEDWLETGRR